MSRTLLEKLVFDKYLGSIGGQPLCISLIVQLVILSYILSNSCPPVLASDLLVPDDFPTISDALDAAESGDTIIVKPGTYYERIKMKEGVALVSFAGDGGNDLVKGPGLKKVLKRTLRTIIDGSQIEEPGYLISFPSETTEPMEVDGFTFRNMPKYASSVNLFLMEIRACSPVVVNNVFTGNKSWGGILATGLGIGMGPELETKAKPIIRNNIIYGNAGPGIANGSNSAAIITENEIFENRFPHGGQENHFAPGIGVREKARPLIKENLCYRNGVGIGVLSLDSNEQPLVIQTNRLYENSMAGISVRGVGGPGIKSQVCIEYNQIFHNLEAGVRFTKVAKASVYFNEIYGNRKSGLSLWDVNKAIVEDNEIFGNFTSGIRLLDVPSAIVRRNHIYGNVTAGIDIISWERN